MLVIAHHSIRDTEKFWSTAKALTNALPSNLKLHSVFPSMDMKNGTCIWEGPSVNSVQKFIDEKTGSVSKNFCYEVNTAASMGLPQMAKEAVHN